MTDLSTSDPSADAPASAGPGEAPGASPKPAIEVGWVLVAPAAAATREGVERALRRFVDYARASWPEFAWRMTLVVRQRRFGEHEIEPVALLDLGMAELDAAHWDFSFVITEGELRAYDKPFALGVTARSYGVAVMSTARLEPPGWGEASESADLGERLFALALHELGHLNDLPHSPDPEDYMFDLKDVPDLDRMRQLSEPGREKLRAQLVEVADLRVEERLRTRSALRFYVHGTWTNRWQILRAVAKMRPWAFPLRLSRLTTAALSTMVVFLITAEAWELGMRQRPALVLALSVFALAATSFYVLERQRLVERLRTQRFSEQRVLGNVSMIAAVLLGMATTYALVFATALLATQVVFDPGIIGAWTGRESGIRLQHFLVLCGFIAAVAILIGALGASFEAEGYFRHVALVDEET